MLEITGEKRSITGTSQIVALIVEVVVVFVSTDQSVRLLRCSRILFMRLFSRPTVRTTVATLVGYFQRVLLEYFEKRLKWRNMDKLAIPTKKYKTRNR